MMIPSSLMKGEYQSKIRANFLKRVKASFVKPVNVIIAQSLFEERTWCHNLLLGSNKEMHILLYQM
jgi:hypothetical protein